MWIQEKREVREGDGEGDGEAEGDGEVEVEVEGDGGRPWRAAGVLSMWDGNAQGRGLGVGVGWDLEDIGPRAAKVQYEAGGLRFLVR
jgi:hypothetical protein